MSNRLLTMLVATGLFATGSLARAQDIDLNAGNSTVVWRGTAADARAGTFLDQGPVSGNDGSPDLIIGAPGTGAMLGRVYIVFSGNTRTGSQDLSSADVVIAGAAAGDGFGTMAATGNILDTENSNPRNLLVAAPNADGGRGVVYLFAAGFTAGQSLTTGSAVYRIVGAPGDLLGTTLATGDLNFDGRREIIIGAPGTDRLYIINGAAGLSGTRQLESQPADVTLPAPGFGDALASGDVTGDGVDDVVVGAPAQNGLFLFRGHAGLGIAAFPDVTVVGTPGEALGTHVRLGDLDDDGVRDIQIGSPLSDGPGGTRPDCGAIYVMWGGATLTSRELTLSPADLTFYGEASGGQLGSFFNYGDINRDALDDLVMSSFGPGGASQLQLYYGRGRDQFGVPSDGRRLVDLASPGNVNRRIYGIAASGVVSATQVFELTGDGARDVIVGVSTEANGGTAGAGAVHFTLSPRMFLGSQTITFWLPQGGSGQAGVEVRNTSPIPITWSATSKASWLSVSAASGSTANAASGHFTVTASPGPLAPGTYIGEIEVNSTSVHLEMKQTLTVTVVIRPISAPPLDFDGDARAEIAVYRPSHGYWFFLSSASGYSTSQTYLWGSTGDVPVPGDYDGDRLIDIAVYRPSQGYWLFLTSTSNYSAWQAYLWGSTGDIPMPGDYDGDARTDMAVYRPSSGAWFILKSSSNFSAADVHSWGAAGDRPAAGDYDGDGKIDLAVYRPGTGQWLIKLSTTDYSTWMSALWGTMGDVLVPADYDGDLKADIAVYRPSTGTWFVLTSASGFASSFGYVWGASGDVPVPADYDGDQRTDIAIYRPSTGAWFVLRSSTGYSSWWVYQWGMDGDLPLSSRGSIQ